MKKLLIVLGILSVLSLSAYARGGYGMMGYGHMGGHMGGYGMMGDSGMGHGACPYGYDEGADFTPITEEEAKKKVEEYIAANYKGYSVKEIGSIGTTGRYTAYEAKVVDVSGNEFYFVVKPNGYVYGPINKGLYR